MPDEDTTVIVHLTPKTYALIIHYVYADGTTAFNTHYESVPYGEKYSVTCPTAPEGYVADVTSISGTMSASGFERTVTYTPIGTGSYTVHFVDEDGNKLADDLHADNVAINKTITVNAIAISGYSLQSDISHNITPSTDGTEYSFVYRKDVNSEKHTLTIYYMVGTDTSDTQSILQTYSKAYSEGETYKVDTPSSIVMDNRRITDPDTACVEGTMGTSNVVVYVTYKNAVDIPQEPISYTLTVDYVDQDSNKIADSKTIKDCYGATGVESPIAIDHYHTSDSEQAYTIGKTTNITFTYEIDTYNVNYYVDGNLYKTILGVPYGSELSLIDDDMTKDGYTFSGWSNLPETMPAGNVSIVGTYKIDTTTDNTGDNSGSIIVDDNKTADNSQTNNADNTDSNSSSSTSKSDASSTTNTTNSANTSNTTSTGKNTGVASNVIAYGCIGLASALVIALFMINRKRLS